MSETIIDSPLRQGLLAEYRLIVAVNAKLTTMKNNGVSVPRSVAERAHRELVQIEALVHLPAEVALLGVEFEAREDADLGVGGEDVLDLTREDSAENLDFPVDRLEDR